MWLEDGTRPRRVFCFFFRIRGAFKTLHDKKHEWVGGWVGGVYDRYYAIWPSLCFTFEPVSLVSFAFFFFSLYSEVCCYPLPSVLLFMLFIDELRLCVASIGRERKKMEGGFVWK